MSLDPRLRLRHVATFLGIARAGSVAAAAEAAGVTQPAASKTLRELEEILGRRLFERRGRRLALNPAGVAFQRLAGAAMTDLERAQSAARAAQAGATRIVVGALPTAATRLLPDAALIFRRSRPDCLLRVSTGPNWLLLSQLREGTVDMVVGRMADAARMQGLAFRQLHGERIVAAVRAGHPLERLDPPDPLLRFPLILPPGGAVIRQTVLSYLTSVGVGEVAPAFETVSLAFARRALQRSDAIWFISEGVIAEELERGELRTLPLDAPMLAGPVGVSLRADSAPSPEIAELIAVLERVAAGAAS